MRALIQFCGLALAMSCLTGTAASASTKPVPGVGIVVKHYPPAGSEFGAPGLPAIPAGFFGPGSEPFTGVVGLQGQCSYACGGCDDDCDGGEGTPDSRIDYVEDTVTGALEAVMAPAVLYSTAPIGVHVGGALSFFDVVLQISGQVPQPDAPIGGAVQLAPGPAFLPGMTAVVAGGFFDVRCRFTFTDATTGAAVGQSIEADLRLNLQDAGLPVTRLADGTPDGRIVLGLDGSTTVPFVFASDGGALVLELLSLTEAPVGVERSTWGAVKGSYR